MEKKLRNSLEKLMLHTNAMERARVLDLYKANIITYSEARIALGLPSSSLVEKKVDEPKFRTLKHARNRYDYLTRKLNDGKHFSNHDEEDYYILYEIFEKDSSEIQKDSESFQTNSDNFQKEFSNANLCKT